MPIRLKRWNHLVKIRPVCPNAVSEDNAWWIVSDFWTRPGYIQKVATREHAMPIQFRHDVDQVLKDAKAQQKPVLLDFSAAPM